MYVGLLFCLFIQCDMKTLRFCIEHKCISFVFNSNKALDQNLLYTEELQKEMSFDTAQASYLILCLVMKGKV